MGLIGLNGKGSAHLKNLLQMKDVRLTALCDVDPRVLARVGETLKGKQVTPFMTTDAREVFARDLDAGFTDKKARDRIVGEFMKAANKNVDEGAEVVIAAGGVVMAMLAHFGVHEAARNTPILNGITALVKMGEMAVKLDRIMGGRFASKRLQYAPPGPDQIDEIRKYYGDVYPTVKSNKKTTKKK